MSTAGRILKDISDFIFVEDEPAPADIILIPGSAFAEVPERAAELYRMGFAPIVLPSGKFSYRRDRFEGSASKREAYTGDFETEWAFQRDVLMKNGVPESAILREDRSQHTVDNAFFSRKILEEAGHRIGKAILCCRAFHARRCLMTYGWAFPGVEFIVCPVVTEDIARENWHRTKSGRERVLGEVSKCGSYFAEEAAVWSGRA